MLSSLFSFTSHGSGWILKDINGFYVELVWYVPLRGSFYLALPSDLQSMNCLLNVKNPEDNNCFLYCYVAVWLFAYAQSLHENVGWWMRTNPEIYSRCNPVKHHLVPMAFDQTLSFENLNKVQVNAFRYQKKDLIPLMHSVSKRKISFHCEYHNDRNCHSSWTFFLAMVKLTIMFWSKSWNFWSAFWNKFHDPVAKYAVNVLICPTQLKFTKDILKLASKTKQPLLNYQMKRKTSYTFKTTSPGVSHMLCILTLSRSSNL